jgi:hypothetical protein
MDGMNGIFFLGGRQGKFFDRINKIYRIGRQGNLDMRNMKADEGEF